MSIEKEKKGPINLFNYKSYRKFLKDNYKKEKEQSLGVTLAKYAKAFNLAASSLKMIMEGERNLTIHNIHVIAKNLKFTPKEREYFEALVLMDQAKTNYEKSYYSQKIQTIQKKTQTKPLRISSRYIFTKWFLPAFLIYLIDKEKVAEKGLDNLDKDKLCRTLNLSSQELEKILGLLKKYGFLDVKTSEKVHFIIDKVTNNFPLKEYIQNVIDESKKRSDKEFNSLDSFFTTYAFSTDPSQMKKFEHDFKELMEKYIQEGTQTEDNQSHKIVQVSLQMFPVF